MWVCGGVGQHDKTKTPDGNDLKLGIQVVVLDNVSKPTDLGSKGQEFRVWGLGYG